ncbi:hypothetical protein BBW65_07180 [Helicobacter enhydrae]|uniref:Uncharacterized protein n=1 Tax=Helicobacter enhydrae TaxID=222136 RepID=A0A1B1U748_9HELI|nr:hypothetical protein [Helicobacter enhydrae]ANV98589.1 hypothetical protein BBW65_07180 [Helicobacter enhydrae]
MKVVSNENGKFYKVESHSYNDESAILDPDTQYLIVGTFPVVGTNLEVEWFYGSKDNSFWGQGGKDGLIQQVFSCDDILDTKEKRQEFMRQRGMAFVDLF